jgi:hypothetical protein
MAKSDNSHLRWSSRIMVECSIQNPKVKVLNPTSATGKENNDEIVKIHICHNPVAQWS